MSKRIRGYGSEWDETLLVGIGQAHGVMPPEDAKGRPAGRLYVPDPEARRGWREFYVDPEPMEKPGARPLGFRR